MQNLPFYIPLLFVITTVITFFFISRSFRHSNIVIAAILIWLTLQAIVANAGFYTHTAGMPPRFLLVLLPPLAVIAILFSTTKGKKLIDNMPAGTLTLLHIVRIPVEVVLLMLCIHKTIPGIMTFEGRNFDIISGITAPVVYYIGFVAKKMRPWMISAWNILCLLLLANIIITAVLSFPFPFQQLAFDQPNIALLYAPYIWLPSFIVPVVLFSHLVVLRQVKKKTVLSNEAKQNTKLAIT